MSPVLVAALVVVCALLAGAAAGVPSRTHASSLSFKLDHFLCYSVKSEGFKPRGVVVLDPQFKPARKTVVAAPETLCNWASKNGRPVRDKTRHLLCYTTRSGQAFRTRRVLVTNQFKQVRLAVARPNALCVPSGKSLERVAVNPSKNLDHFQCYPVKPLSKVPTRKVRVADEFGENTYVVGRPARLCDPASKNRSRIVNRRDHLLCYVAKPVDQTFRPRPVFVTNQFGRIVPYVPIEARSLCLPSLKRIVTPPPPQRPDLTVKIDQASLTVNCPGGGGTCLTKFSMVVTNGGSAAAGAFDVAATADPSQAATLPVAGLAAGGSTTLTATFGPDGNCFDPDCTVTAKADSGNTVTESNEANNTDSFTKPG